MSKILRPVFGLFFVLSMSTTFAAEPEAKEQIFTVKGMHCSSCARAVKSKVCNKSQATCEVKIIDSNQEIGQIRLKPAAGEKSIDKEALRKLVHEAGETYELQ